MTDFDPEAMKAGQAMMDATAKFHLDEQAQIMDGLGVTETCAMKISYLRTRSRWSQPLENELIILHAMGRGDEINMNEWPHEGPRMIGWFSMKDAPKDKPILAWCVHSYRTRDDENSMSLYEAHAEGLSRVKDGPHVLVWGGAFDDRTYEDPNGAWLPDWWFQYGSDFEVAANPVCWKPI